MSIEGSADSPTPAPGRWPRWQLFGFRYLLLHYALYAFPGPIAGLAQTFTGGLALAGVDVAKWPWSLPDASLMGVNLAWQGLTTRMASLGVAPYEVIHQPTGSGDTGHEWARLLFIVVVSLAGAAVWSLLSRAHAYPTLGRWLHLTARFDLAFTMLSYGLMKFYGGQFGELSLSRLTQEIGDTWPMTMVGTFMQASKPYELFGGTCEVLGGLLLFHRRTALIGACVAVATLTNICALNWLYGVPVKQYSAQLLLIAFGLLIPFLPQLWAVFVRNRPSQPVDLRVVTNPRTGRVLMGVGLAWVAAFLVENHVQGMQPRPWQKGQERSALYGLWMVEAMSLDGKEVPLSDSARWRDFAIDRGPLAWARELGGKRHYFEFAWNDAAGSAQVKLRGTASDATTWTFERGTEVVKGDAPELLRQDDRGKQVDVERRWLVLRGHWEGHDLELRTVEKVFRLQAGFRLRQELPDFW